MSLDPHTLRVTDNPNSTADWWGRRRSLSFGVCIFIIGNIIQITAMNSWVHMMMGRFVAGLGIGNLSVGVPMFQSESSPKEIRGAVVATYQLMITFGILVSNIINFGVRTFEEKDSSWRIVIGLGIAFSVPLGVGILFVPESPRWLAGRHDWDGARMAMARLRGLKHDPTHHLIERDLKEMRASLEEESSVGVGSWLECFTGKPSNHPKVVYRTFLGMGIHFLQQWTGVNFFFYYGASIFASAGIDDPIKMQLILGAVNVVMTFYGLYVVEKYGRRWPLFLGALWQAAWLAVFAGVGTALDAETNRTVGIVMIVSACMFIASFAGTWGPIAWVVIGETFPLRTRAKQASIATATNWLGNCKPPLPPPPTNPILIPRPFQSSLASSPPSPPTASVSPTASSSSAATSPPPCSSGSSSTSPAPSASSTSTSCTPTRASSRGRRPSGPRRGISRASSATRRGVLVVAWRMMLRGLGARILRGRRRVLVGLGRRGLRRRGWRMQGGLFEGLG